MNHHLHSWNEISVSGQDHNRRFEYSCELATKRYIASSSTKKGAKEKSAKLMIDNFYDIFGHTNVNESSFESVSSNEESATDPIVNSVGALFTLCSQYGLQSPQ